MGAIIFVTGGARSGKSRFAEEQAQTLGAPVTYLATMAPGDDELRGRIARHRAHRAASWRTVEEEHNLAGALGAAPRGDTVILDCLSLWVSNRIFAQYPGDDAPPADWEALVDAISIEAHEATATAAGRDGSTIVVTNEVGAGIVPADRLSRYYRDALGIVNQRFAARSGAAYLLVSGLPLRLK